MFLLLVGIQASVGNFRWRNRIHRAHAPNASCTFLFLHMGEDFVTLSGINNHRLVVIADLDVPKGPCSGIRPAFLLPGEAEGGGRTLPKHSVLPGACSVRCGPQHSCPSPNPSATPRQHFTVITAATTAHVGVVGPCAVCLSSPNAMFGLLIMRILIIIVWWSSIELEKKGDLLFLSPPPPLVGFLLVGDGNNYTTVKKPPLSDEEVTFPLFLDHLRLRQRSLHLDMSRVHTYQSLPSFSLSIFC